MQSKLFPSHSPLPAPTHPVQGVSILCMQENRFLLVKRAHAPYQHWLAFPGGKVDKGENGQQAAKRELLEETNLVANELVHLVTLDLGNTAQKTESYFLSVYHVVDISENAQAGDDALSLCWVSLQEMEQLRVIPSVLQVAKAFVDELE